MSIGLKIIFSFYKNNKLYVRDRYLLWAILQCLEKVERDDYNQRDIPLSLSGIAPRVNEHLSFRNIQALSLTTRLLDHKHMTAESPHVGRHIQCLYLISMTGSSSGKS